MTWSRRDVLKSTLSATALAGLGAVAATATSAKGLADEQRAEFNVQDYGATGNGTSDDTAAIHAARDAAGVGGRLFFPTGLYRVNQLSATVQGQSWAFDSNAVVRMQAVPPGGFGWCLRVYADGVTVTGGVFDAADGTAHDGKVNAVTINGANAKFDGVTVKNSPWNGIAAYNKGGITITRCTILNSHKWALGCQNSTEPFISDLHFRDNIIDSSDAGDQAQGIGIQGDHRDSIRAKRIVVTGNSVTLPLNPITQSGLIQLLNCSDFVCSNNTTLGGGMPITTPNAINGVIANNSGRTFNYSGIEIPGNVENVVVYGNILDPDGQPAIGGIVHSAGKIRNVLIVNNSVTNFSSSKAGLVSFSSGSDPSGISIADNILKSTAATNMIGIYFNSPCNNISISNNTIDGGSAANTRGAEFIHDAHDVSIAGNQFSNLSLAAVRLGPTGVATYNHIKLTRNTVVNCGDTLLKAVWGSGFVGPDVTTEPS